MSVLWTSEDAASATGGTGSGGAWAATGVSIDTRTLQPGDLFVALQAARDGHDFVADALAKGAAAALVSRVPEGTDGPLLLVEDVQTALEALGRAGRARMQGQIIAVTGSVGKTTTKDMLRTALAPQGRTHASVESYNNHWGVPLTLARMPADTEFGIIEIGMNAPGEIAPLSKMARPHVAMVTTVAAAHLEAFGSLDGIAEEKASIFEGLEPGGTAIINADLGATPILEAAAQRAGATLVTFGEQGRDLRLVQSDVIDTATIAQAVLRGTELMLKMPVPGAHLAMNAMGALAAIDASGGDPAIACLALAQWTPVSGRGAREVIKLGPLEGEAVEIIDDAFNASPASVAAGLQVLAAAEPKGKGRRIALLGDMLELGPTAAALHADLAAHPALSHVDLVHTAGSLMAHLNAALPPQKRGQHCDTADALARALPHDLRAGDILLIKGSKSSYMSRVVEMLRKLGQAVADRG